MMATNVHHQYWYLFRWLMLPARFHYWLFMLSSVLTIVALGSALIGSLLKVGDWRLVVVGVWAIVFSVWFISAVLVLHGQLLALPSNRQMHLISGVRQRALLIHWLVLAIMAALFTVFQYFLRGIEFTLANVIVNWSLCLLASVMFLLCLKWLANFALLGIWLLGMGFATFIEPLDISPWLLFVLALVLWLSFCYWWLRWLPAQKIENVFLLRNWQSLQRKPLCHWSKLPINMLAPRIKMNYNSASLYIHLLNGVTGNFLSRVMTWLLVGGLAVVGLSLMVWLGYGAAVGEMAKVAIPITLWTFLASAGMGYFVGIFANLSRAWLYFPGTRAELLGAVEKNFVMSLLIDLFFICSLMSLAVNWVFPEYLLIKWILLYCLLVLVVNWALFHFAWYLYCRTQGNSNVLNLAIFFIIVAQLLLAGVGWSLVSSETISAEALALGAIGGVLPAALLLRFYAQKATPTMNFARGKV